MRLNQFVLYGFSDFEKISKINSLQKVNYADKKVIRWSVLLDFLNLLITGIPITFLIDLIV